MATYKVIQDIEAEDKLLGPLSLRQFIYAGICVLCLYLSFLTLTKHVGFLIVVFAPVAIFTGFFAFPWKLNQPTEIWALAKIRFLLKPRRRIWDQSGVKELVTITAPKRIESNYTNGLSQTEVKSRLKALADTIDSHGWAVKNVNVNLTAAHVTQVEPDTDRLINASTLPQEVPTFDVQATDDMLDAQTNPVAQQFDEKITASNQEHRQQLVQQLQEAQDQPAVDEQPSFAKFPPPSTDPEPTDYWFNDQPTIPTQSTTTNTQLDERPEIIEDEPWEPPKSHAPRSADEASLSKRLKKQAHKSDVAYSHMRTLSPRTAKKIIHKKPQPQPAPVTQTPAPAILKLASNNDLNVATIARQVKQKEPAPMPDEVIISLH